jgi:hypothetical protein
VAQDARSHSRLGNGWKIEAMVNPIFRNADYAKLRTSRIEQIEVLDEHQTQKPPEVFGLPGSSLIVRTVVLH